MSDGGWTVADGKLQIWERRWRDDQLRWHKFQVSPYLIKYIEMLTSERLQDENKESTDSVSDIDGPSISQENEEFPQPKSESSPKTFFIPLCGKTMDIAYILSLGHSVFAIEGVKLAIETLDQENSFGLVYDPKESIYSTGDGKLKIYCGNIFTCPIEKWGPFDSIWDRGSLTALEIPFRPAYIDIMKRSVQGASGKYHEFRYLLQAYTYDKTKSDGRGPKCVDGEDMDILYGDWTDFKLLNLIPLPREHVLQTMVRESEGTDDGSTSTSTACTTIYILKNKEMKP